MGTLYSSQGNYVLGENYYLKAISTFGSDTVLTTEGPVLLLSSLLDNLGYTYRLDKKFNLAITTLIKSLSLLNEISINEFSYAERKLTTLNNLTALYLDIKQMKLVKQLSFKELRILGHLDSNEIEERIDHKIYNNLAEAYEYENLNDSAQFFFKKSISILNRLYTQNPAKFESLLPTIYYDYSQNLGKTGQFDSSLFYLNMALNIINPLLVSYPQLYYPLKASVYDEIGFIYGSMENYDIAENCFEEAIIIYKKLMQERSGIYETDLSNVMANMGFTFYNKRDFNLSISYYDSALSLIQSCNDPINMQCISLKARELNSLGEVEVNLGENVIAKSHFYESYTIYSQLFLIDSNAYQFNLGNVCFNLGNSYIDSNFDSAEFYFKSAIQFQTKLQDQNPFNKFKLANSYSNYGFIFINRDLQKATRSFEYACSLRSSLHNDGKFIYDDKYFENLNALGVLYEKQGDNRKAYNYYAKASVIYSSLDVDSKKAYTDNIRYINQFLSNH